MAFSRHGFFHHLPQSIKLYLLSFVLFVLPVCMYGKSLDEPQSFSNDYDKAKYYQNLSDSLQDKDWRSSLDYAEKAYEIAKKEGYQDILASVLLTLGDLNYYHDSRKEGFNNYEDGYQYALKINDYQLQYAYIMEIAKYHLYGLLDSETAISYYGNAIKIAEENDKPIDIGRAYAKMAIAFVRNKDVASAVKHVDIAGNYFINAETQDLAVYYFCDIGSRLWDYDMDQAMDLYLKALEVNEEHYSVRMGIGSAYISLGLPENALSYLNHTKESLDQDNWKYGICMTYLADAYVQLEQYDKADSICNLNIERYTNEGSRNQRCLPETYRIKGKINELKGNDQEALGYYKTAYQKANDLRIGIDQLKASLSTGEYYIGKDSELAINYCQLTYDTSASINQDKIKASACDCLYLAHKDKGDYSLALKYLEEKRELEKSLNADNAVQKLNVFEKLKSRENEVAYEQKLKDEQLKSQKQMNKYQSVVIVIGSILILSLLYFFRRIKKQNEEIIKKSNALLKSNTKLTQSNGELERFAYIISHDLKTPMLIILEFTKLLSEELRSSFNPVASEYMEHIVNGGKRMMNLIEDVLDFSKNTNQNVVVEEIRLCNLVKEISKLVLVKDDSKKIIMDHDTLPIIQWNYTKMFQLFKNLIENGLKYNNSEQPTVHIYGVDRGNGYTICFEDNGIGIEEKYHDSIFVMFNRLHNYSTYNGSGLGLATCKKIVQEFEGEISLSSEKGNGTTFMISIPIEMISAKYAVSV